MHEYLKELFKRPVLRSLVSTDIPADDVQGIVDREEILPAERLSFDKQIVPQFGRAINGRGRSRTRLEYSGEPRDDGCIMMPGGTWGGAGWSNLSLANVGKVKTGTGFAAGTDISIPPGGTQSAANVWDTLIAAFFEVGFRFGTDTGRATSETTTNNVIAYGCKYGVILDDWNTLNNGFNQLGMADCDNGLFAIRAGQVDVFRGSASNIKGPVFKFQEGGVYTIQNFRSEGCGRFTEMLSYGLASRVIRLISCNETSAHNTDGISIAVQWATQLVVENTYLSGKIAYLGDNGKQGADGCGSIELKSVFTQGPILLQGPKNCRARVKITNCGIINPAYEVIRWIPNYEGFLGNMPVIPPIKVK